MQLPAKFDEFLNRPRTHNIFAGGRGGGKTRSVAEFIVEVMARTPLKIICGREVQKSLKESSFLVIREAIQRLGYSQQFKVNESAGTIEGTTGSRAVFIGLLQHTVDSIKSYEGFHWVWIEEAQSVSKRSLETLIPTLRTDGWFAVGNWSFPLRMFIYTMNPYTWEDPINLVLPDSRDDVLRIDINYYDNPWFPEALEQERVESKKTMSHDEYLRVWEGIPFDSAENAVMTRGQVFEAMERNASREGGIVVGADIARFGDDRTVFYKREGLQVIDRVVLAKKDTQEVAIRLNEFAKGNKIVIDDTGVGGGVTDKLRSLGANVVPINFGGSPLDKKKYPDIISEMWFNLAGLIGDIGLPNDAELLAELSGRHYKYTADERRKVESKEEYKKRSGRRSPDLADALILCFYNRQSAMSVPDLPAEMIGGF
jgi:hypothetical protein